MRFFAGFWIALCLVTATHARSITETELFAEDPGKCDCKNGLCVANDKGQYVCTCPTEWGLYNVNGKMECRRCNCGKNFNCTFNPGFFSDGKICLCKVGYEEKSGTCRGTCRKNPCLNGGQCRVKGDDISCSCKTSYSGEFCEKQVSMEICQAEKPYCLETKGVCVDEGKVNCMCESGRYYLADRGCTDPETECPIANCVETKGACLVTSEYEDEVQCLCPVNTEYVKDKGCEVSKETCKAEKPHCLETKGFCVAEEGKVSCMCESGRYYLADRGCTGDPCAPNPCKNGGKCEVTDNIEYNCTCEDGYGGRNCEEIVCTVAGIEYCGPAKCVIADITEKVIFTKCVCEDGNLFDENSRSCKENPCNSEPCENGGMCHPKGVDSYRCECKEGFIGKTCNEFTCTPKEKEKCGPATCQIKHSSREVICVCPDGELFDGENKECKANPCYSNPCGNSTCHLIDVDSYLCECVEGYGGKHCDERICTPKEEQDCGTAKCVFLKSSGKGECLCVAGEFFDTNKKTCIAILTSTSDTTQNLTGFWTTEDTSQSDWLNSTITTAQTTADIDVCTENPCQNGGTCLVVGNTSKCVCRKPYLGILCETDPCAWNPCKNGGLCRVENETIACFCKQPFAGEFCESRTRIDVYVITLIAVSVFLAVVVLIFLTCVLCRRFHVTK